MVAQCLWDLATICRVMQDVIYQAQEKDLCGFHWKFAV